MAVPVPFGQYVQGDSAVHRLDARVKVIVTAAFTVALFAVGSWRGLAVTLLIAVLAVAASKTPLRLVARGILPIMWLLAFTLVVNSLFPAQRTVTLLQLGPLALDQRGLVTGLFFAVRILLLVVGTSLVTLTTSPVALTDALSQMMRPLDALKFPVDDVAMMMSIALRFMPTTAEEAERIIVAQTSRGASFDSGGPVKRVKAWLPVLVPLFVRLFRRADSLAVAMESRCYRGRGRTRLREPRMGMGDWITLVGGVSIALAVAVLL